MCLDRAKTLYSGRCFTGMSSLCRLINSVLNRNRPVNKPSSCGGFVEVFFFFLGGGGGEVSTSVQCCKRLLNF